MKVADGSASRIDRLALRNGHWTRRRWTPEPVCIFRTKESLLNFAAANLGLSSTPWPIRTFCESPLNQTCINVYYLSAAKGSWFQRTNETCWRRRLWSCRFMLYEYCSSAQLHAAKIKCFVYNVNILMDLTLFELQPFKAQCSTARNLLVLAKQRICVLLLFWPSGVRAS